MREVHRRLRAALDLAREAIEDESDPDPALIDPLLYCWGYCTALTGHHHAEDGVLFPWLTAHHPELAPLLARLRQDHSMIEHLVAGLRRALETGSSTADKLRHLDGVEAVMLTHFRYEERSLLALLDTVDDDEPAAGELYGALAD